ncbi:hypothetical protein [Streptomyces cavernae]|uniref:hypothetical protein n=1 Tax=Streptomyces cavernae TaxID=2259034 RepID=UPI0012D92452|nr:hypothetical protein [Streptomyces cavernae]
MFKNELPGRFRKLSDEARGLYERMAQGLTPEDGEPGLQELLDVGLAFFEPIHGSYAPTNPALAEQRVLAAVRDQIDQALALTQAFPELGLLFQDGRRRNRGSEFLEPKLVNARIAESMDTAKAEIYAAQPGRRTADSLQRSHGRDMAALRRDVTWRTLYSNNERTNPATRQRVETMRAEGAHVRTLTEPFHRFIVIDRREAYIGDFSLADAPPLSAWHITDAAVAAFLAELFDQMWARADDWSESARPKSTSRIDKTLRTILDLLSNGWTQKQIATRLGVSDRVINGHLSTLRQERDFNTNAQLAHWWATAPERRDG